VKVKGIRGIPIEMRKMAAFMLARSIPPAVHANRWYKPPEEEYIWSGKFILHMILLIRFRSVVESEGEVDK
jgi:hypothetical protein